MSTIAGPLALAGERFTGKTVRSQNVMASLSISNIVKTSLGPVGLDKMLVDDVGDVTITNDGATILKMLDVEHPAAKVLVELAQLQDEEVGDGTTSVVIIAAELLKHAETLTNQKIHPTSIIAGYRLACKEAVRYIQDQLTYNVDTLDSSCLISAVKSSMSSKLIGADSDFFAKMVVDAVHAIRIVDSSSSRYATVSKKVDSANVKGSDESATVGGCAAKGSVVSKKSSADPKDDKDSKVKKASTTKYTYPIKAINILKAHGKMARESRLINGYALNCTIAAQQMPKFVENAKIACLDFSLNKSKMKMGIEVLITNPDNLEAIRDREADMTKERIEKILEAGANVILVTGGIDDLCLKYFVEAKAMAVRRCKKVDLKRIAKATGATLLSSLVSIEDGEERFDKSYLGEAESVSQERICDDELILVKGPKARSAASIILRGANDFACDEMERSLHDALCVVKRVLESNEVVVGGGCVESALSIYLENFATTLSSREQLAIAEFAKSMLVIPKTLAINAAQDASDLISRLRSYHHASQTSTNTEKRDTYKAYGLDLYSGCVRDNKSAGVFEPAISKVKALKFATEAAITVLRIDDLIKLEPEKGEERSYQQALRSGELEG